MTLNLLVLSGCALFMPEEIVRMQERTSMAAKHLKDTHPEWFHTYEVDGRTMHFVEVVSRQPKPLVILIHGSPGDWRGWTDYLTDETLTAKAHLIAVDRPGFGSSGAGKVERSLAQQSKDVAPLLDRVQKGQRVILVGHSYGGPLAARMAIDYPKKVTDVIILAGSIDPALEETKWYQYPADWRLIRWAVPSVLTVTNQEIMALKEELTTMLPLWVNIRQRVTVIQGGKDDLVPAANADFAEEKLVNAASLSMIRLPETNHFLPWNQTALVKETIVKHSH
ncbi:MAG: alpha/beta hydrolase [Rickettsiales bacterium]|nr:alpha/beta hydrolase [Rickettsiales bacterium]